MKKIVLISLITFLTTLFADSNLGVRIQTNVGNTNVSVKFKSDDHRYDKKYKSFNYKKNGYFDDYGYYFGYFDKKGYFYNNIFFLYNSKYTYKDRLYKRGSFKHNKAHYRKYVYTKGNNWNKEHKFRKENEIIYGHYHQKESTKKIKTSNKKYKNTNYKNSKSKNNYKKNNNKKTTYKKNNNKKTSYKKNNNKNQKIYEDNKYRK